MKIENILSIVVEQPEEFLDSILEYENHTVKESLKEWYDGFIPDTDDEPIIALMEHLDEDYDTCENYISKENYLVVDDDTADELWEEALDNYLDECILPDLPEEAKYYFDRDSWISDAKMDGRGHSLSTYDGNEYEETVAGTTYYIYRIG